LDQNSFIDYYILGLYSADSYDVSLTYNWQTSGPTGAIIDTTYMGEKFLGPHDYGFKAWYIIIYYILLYYIYIMVYYIIYYIYYYIIIYLSIYLFILYLFNIRMIEFTQVIGIMMKIFHFY
jgi:hypothetical protein